MEKTYWENAWDEAKLASPTRTRPGNEACWGGFWDGLAEQYLREILAGEPFYRGIRDYLVEREVLRPGDRVLDVGCGPGTYALPFAEKASSVDALDPSGPMLAALAGEAARRGLANLKTMQARWEDFATPDRYDLVFSSMSPAISDTPTLLKMEALSCRSCCLITYGDAPEAPERKALWPQLVGDYRPSNMYMYTYPYNVLRERGREPGLRMFDQEERQLVPVEQMVKRFTDYFAIFTTLDAGKIGRIREYFEARAPGGLYEEKGHTRLAVISWDRPEEPPR